uniref:Methyltransferase 23, arginine n=1 Tax=Gallus gallus TaxID=9031 RepID=A0A8V1AHV8_CHICK
GTERRPAGPAALRVTSPREKAPIGRRSLAPHVASCDWPPARRGHGGAAARCAAVPLRGGLGGRRGARGARAARPRGAGPAVWHVRVALRRGAGSVRVVSQENTARPQSAGDFEDILTTVYFLLEKNPHAQFWTTYQVRSADWSIEALLYKWKLKSIHIPLHSFSADKEHLASSSLPSRHTIEMMIISLARSDGT